MTRNVLLVWETEWNGSTLFFVEDPVDKLVALLNKSNGRIGVVIDHSATILLNIEWAQANELPETTSCIMQSRPSVKCDKVWRHVCSSADRWCLFAN